MANVSSSNGLEKRPKLRFPGFDEPWHGKPFGDLIQEYSDRTQTEDEDTLLSAAIEGMFLNSELFGHQRGASNKGYKKIKYGTMVLSTQNLHLGNANVNLRFKHGMVSPAYKTYDITGCSIELLAHWIKSDAAKHFFYNATTVGASMCRRNVEWKTLYEQPLFLPSTDEQDKIASFLSFLTQRIDAQQKYVATLKKYKRGLSDELSGEKGPGERWMTVPFSEAFDLLQNNTFSRDEMSTENGIAYNIHYGDVLIKYGAVVDLSKSKVPYIRSDVSLSKFARSSYLRNGDIVIADTAEDYTVGKAVEIVGVADTKALSGLHTIPCRPKISFASMYLGYFINSKRFRTQILPLVQGTKVSSISKSEIQKTSIAFPSFEVQSQIASVLYALDHRIDICQACVHGLVRTKEALLQQLFI